MAPSHLETGECESRAPENGLGPDAPASRQRARPKLRALFVSHGCYLETSNGASVATRAMMECLARHGCAAEALSGTVFDSEKPGGLESWLAEQGLTFEPIGPSGASMGTPGSAGVDPAYYRMRVRNVGIMLHRCPTMSTHGPDEAECQAFLQLLEETLVRVRPDVVVGYGGDAFAVRLRGRARAFGAAVVCPLHHLHYRSAAPFADTDLIIAPSRFAASYYRRILGLECVVLPNLIDFERVRAETRDPRYVTFVNPSYEKGVYVFARIADELGRRRPDIPLLVVESRGTERTLVDCGLDLRTHGNVSVMRHTPDPRHFWSVTRVAIMPSLCWENQPLVAIEAMINGVPVIGSDRGGAPEALGDAGIVLGLPQRLTPSTQELPTAREVEPWVKAIVGLWDDSAWYAEQSLRSASESRRWAPEVLEPRYLQFLEDLRPHSPPV